ncbi:hypothetical protein RF11_14677 [Thelohanellus kitauei]|uniref:Uncharacterized protein n=1 Tax=Thelohanellus kitauei TaxID=669202 RepID=A0A0C2MUP5_THEKT|nr:hypothetical protein RF11_14677 [Thelohanellus kitauei]
MKKSQNICSKPSKHALTPRNQFLPEILRAKEFPVKMGKSGLTYLHFSCKKLLFINVNHVIVDVYLPHPKVKTHSTRLPKMIFVFSLTVVGLILPIYRTGSKKMESGSWFISRCIILILKSNRTSI